MRQSRAQENIYKRAEISKLGPLVSPKNWLRFLSFLYYLQMSALQYSKLNCTSTIVHPYVFYEKVGL